MPLPAGRDALLASAALGRQVAALLDTETAGPRRHRRQAPAGVEGDRRRRPASAAAASTRRRRAGRDGPLGRRRQGRRLHARQGQAVERAYTAEERAALPTAPPRWAWTRRRPWPAWGDTTFDVYLNDVAYWRNVPARVWAYTLGGYQVMKKWLSYREKALLGRGLTLDEVTEVTHMARRIAALLLLHPALDANYQAVKAAPIRGLELQGMGPIAFPPRG